MSAHGFAKKLYLSGASNSASSVLQGLRHEGLIECSDELLQTTTAFGRGLASQKETCSCLLAAAMAAGLATARTQDKETAQMEAEKLTTQVVEEFRKKYKTIRCAEILAGFPDFSSDLRKGYCADIVEFTTRVTAELLAQREINRGTMSLTSLIDFLNRLPQSELTIEKVTELMENVHIRHDEIEKCLNFSEDGYARNLFYKNDRFEFLVMCWDKGQLSPIHDHDQSISVEKIYSGKILCTNYRLTDSDTETIEETDSQLAEEGSVITGRLGEIHRIANIGPSSSKAVSIHFYSPPLKRMKTFSLNSDSAQWIKLRYLYIYRPEVWKSLESCNL
jgi:cysteine dioxygenase